MTDFWHFVFRDGFLALPCKTTGATGREYANRRGNGTYYGTGKWLRCSRLAIAGCTPNPHERWIKQIARNLTDPFDGILNGKRYLIMGRDTKFCAAFRQVLKNEGVKSLRLPPRSPNLNAYLERYFRSLKRECLSKMIFFGETAS
jgi:hypothetical protein